MTEYNKVVYDGQTLIDLTQDDVQASDVRNGVYFHSADGVRSQGTLASTSVPTADTIAEWDSDAHMNSEDMTSQEVDDFVDGLNVQGGGVTKTTFTPQTGNSYSNYGGCFYEVCGNFVHVHLGISGLTSGGSATIYTLPSSACPDSHRFTVGTVGNNTGFCVVEVHSNGGIYAYPVNGTYCGADLMYFV